MNRRDWQILLKIQGEMQVLSCITQNQTVQAFLNDEIRQRAACMTLINIGELVKNLTDEIKMKYKHVAWRYASGLRDIAAHKYDQLNMEDIWKTIQINIPDFSSHIDDILRDGRDKPTEKL